MQKQNNPLSHNILTIQNQKHNRNPSLKMQREIPTHKTNPKIKISLPQGSLDSIDVKKLASDIRRKKSHHTHQLYTTRLKQPQQSQFFKLNKKDKKSLSYLNNKFDKTSIHKFLFARQFDYGHLQQQQRTLNLEQKSLLNISKAQTIGFSNKQNLNQTEILNSPSKYQTQRNQAKKHFPGNPRIINETVKKLLLRNQKFQQDKQNMNSHFLYPPNQEHFELQQQISEKQKNEQLKKKVVSKIISKLNGDKIETKIIRMPQNTKNFR